MWPSIPSSRSASCHEMPMAELVDQRRLLHGARVARAQLHRVLRAAGVADVVGHDGGHQRLGEG